MLMTGWVLVRKDLMDTNARSFLPERSWERKARGDRLTQVHLGTGRWNNEAGRQTVTATMRWRYWSDSVTHCQQRAGRLVSQSVPSRVDWCSSIETAAGARTLALPFVHSLFTQIHIRPTDGRVRPSVYTWKPFPPLFLAVVLASRG